MVHFANSWSHHSDAPTIVLGGSDWSATRSVHVHHVHPCRPLYTRTIKTMLWATAMTLSPLTMKGLIVFAPIVVVAAHIRWTWWLALAIVLGTVSMASAKDTYHDEQTAMDFDTCNEHQGDISEHFLHDWKVVRQEDKVKSSHWVYEKGSQEVHLICENGESIIQTKPVEPRGKVDFMK